MVNIKSLTYNQITKTLLGQKVRFISDCEFFPNFDVTGKVLSVNLRGNEIMLKCKCNNGKIIDIGSNMKNLRYEIII